MAKVVVAIGKQQITSIVTADAVRELDLKRGDSVAALVKSTDDRAAGGVGCDAPEAVFFTLEPLSAERKSRFLHCAPTMKLWVLRSK